MEDKLKPCPCGKTPHELNIGDAGQGGKWARVNGDCCGEWNVEFRTDYHDLDSDECMELAITGWEDAPRSTKEQALTDEVKHKQESIQVLGFMLAQEKSEVARLSKAMGEANITLDDLMYQMTSRGLDGDRLYGMDEWSTPVLKVKHLIDKFAQLLNSKGPTDNT